MRLRAILSSQAGVTCGFLMNTLVRVPLFLLAQWVRDQDYASYGIGITAALASDWTVSAGMGRHLAASFAAETSES